MIKNKAKKKVNICLVYPGYPPEESLGGGISTFLADFAKFLNYLDCRVNIITRSEKNKNIKIEERKGITIYRLPGENKSLTKISPFFAFNQIGAIDYAKRLVQLVLEIEKNYKPFDIIEVVDWGAEAFYLIQERIFKNRVVIRCHTPSFISESFNPSNKTYLSPFIKEMEKYVLQKSKHITSYSKSLMALIEKQMGIRIPYTLQTFFIQEKGIHQKKSYKLNFSLRKKMKIVTVGRVEERKGIDVLIKAVEKLIDKKYQIQLDIIGSTTPLRNGSNSIMKWKKHLSKNKKYQERIKFLGFLPRKQAIKMYNSYDLFIMASRFESWGLAIVEAIYAGIPTIISDACTISEHLRDKKDCFVFKNEQVNDLTKKIIYVYKNYNKIIPLTQNAKETIKNRFDPFDETEKIKNYYFKIIKS